MSLALLKQFHHVLEIYINTEMTNAVKQLVDTRISDIS